LLSQPLSGATVNGEKQGTVGERIYLIREALGTRRDPMPLDKLAELIERTTGAVYDKSILSRMETGERKVSLDDVAVLASVDPLKRGKAWLAWGDPAAAEKENGGASSRPPAQPSEPTPMLPDNRAELRRRQGKKKNNRG
jgi:hypothetical protein